MFINLIHYNRYINFIYSRQYRIISKETYTEKHHIIPKCLGGQDKGNIIILTGREHFIAHLILWKAFGSKTSRAFIMMRSKNEHENNRYFSITSRQYEQLKQDIKPWNKGLPHSDETKKKISESHKGLISPRKGKILSEKTKKKISEANKGHISHSKGKTNIYSKETIQKMSYAKKGKTYIEIYGEEKAKIKIEKRKISIGKRKWMHTIQLEKLIPFDEINTYLDNDWVLGRKIS